MMKINKIIMSLMLVLTLTFGCITTSLAAPEDRKFADTKVYQKGDKVYIEGQYQRSDGTPQSGVIRIVADYDDGSRLVTEGAPALGPSLLRDAYVGKVGYRIEVDTDDNGYIRDEYMDPRIDPDRLVGFDADLIKRNDLKHIYLQSTYHDTIGIVYDRDIDGPIVDYLDNQKR